jgi:hypothetical protein
MPENQELPDLPEATAVPQAADTAIGGVDHSDHRGAAGRLDRGPEVSVRGADDRDQLRVGGRARGRQDDGQVQRRRRRPDRIAEGRRRIASGFSPACRWPRRRGSGWSTTPPSGSSARASPAAASPASGRCSRAPTSAWRSAVAASACVRSPRWRCRRWSRPMRQGRFFQLEAGNLGSLDYGTPIFFRRIQVGQVTSYRLEDDGRGLTVQIFVKAPYDRFVKPETRFWQASGLDFRSTPTASTCRPSR